MKSRVIYVTEDQPSIGLSYFVRQVVEYAAKRKESVTIKLPIDACKAKILHEWIHYEWEYGPSEPPMYVFLDSAFPPTVMLRDMWVDIRYRRLTCVIGREDLVPTTGRVIIFISPTSREPTPDKCTLIRFITSKEVLSLNGIEPFTLTKVDDGKSGLAIYEHISPKTEIHYLFSPIVRPSVTEKTKYMFVLCGTSCAGKSTIANMLAAKGYRVIPRDEVMGMSHAFGLGGDIQRRTLDFASERLKQFGAVEEEELYVGSQFMRERAKGYHTVIFDTIGYSIPRLRKGEGIVIQIYAPFEDMIRNFISRIASEPRDIGVLFAYGLGYVAQPNKAGSIDYANRKTGLKAMQKLKAFFWDEKDLTDFVYRIYAKMGIEDDEDHWIVPNDRYCRADYCITTRDHTPDDIYRKVLKIIKANGGETTPLPMQMSVGGSIDGGGRKVISAKGSKETMERPVTGVAIFDWDGTISDSMPAMWGLTKYAADASKLSFTLTLQEFKDLCAEGGFPAVNEKVFGPDWRTIVPHEKFDEWEKEYKPLAPTPTVFDDIKPSMVRLREKGIKIALLSLAAPDRLNRELAASGLADLVDYIDPGDEVKGPRIRALIEKNPEWRRCEYGVYYIGDLPDDVVAVYEACQNEALITSISVTRSFMAIKEMKARGFCFPTVADAVTGILSKKMLFSPTV